MRVCAQYRKKCKKTNILFALHVPCTIFVPDKNYKNDEDKTLAPFDALHVAVPCMR